MFEIAMQILLDLQNFESHFTENPEIFCFILSRNKRKFQNRGISYEMDIADLHSWIHSLE